MREYAVTESKSPESVAKNEVILVANNDLRQSVNEACWPAQSTLEKMLSDAFIDQEITLRRAHPYDAELRNGFISGQRMGMDAFEHNPPDAPIMFHVRKRKASVLIVGAAISSNTRRRCYRGLLAALCLIVALATANTRASADSVTSAQAQRIVSQYSGSFSSPASCCSSEAPSGPLMGNGNLGVVVVNPINTMTFLLGKNEFWSLNGGQVEPMASISLSIPGMSGAAFAMQENIYTGTVTGQFTLGGNEIQTNSWVSSNDTTNNYLFTQFTYSGSGTQAVTVSLAVGNGNTYPTSSGSSGSVLYYNVAADSTSTVGGYNTHQVRIAVGVVGATGTISGNSLSFTLSPGLTVTLVSSIMSNYDSSSYTTQSISNVSGSTVSTISSELSSNEAWWASFWNASYVEFANNPVLQKEYYGSLYLLACASEPNQAAPGLWGPWVETSPAWAGDYTLDYNYEVPFLASFPTNHVALADSYDAPVENWLPNAEANATSNGYAGAYYPVHIGPLPNGSYQTGTGEENLKSNGSFAATVMLEHYYVTQSSTYAATIWPTISQLATFWQAYLTSNGTSYDDFDDAQQENDPYPQTNGVMSLGLIRNVLQGAINLSTVLGESSSQRATWQDILDNLTTYNGLPFPTETEDGLEVFDLTQVGNQGLSGGDVRNMMIYPGNQVGLGSSPTLLTVAQNTIGVLCCSPYGTGWTNQNITNTFYPAAARVGYNPSTILSELTSWVNNQAQPSFWINSAGGGVEGFNTVPSTISEMMMQSFQGNIIVFPNWPSNTNAHFGDNLAYGNFLVSSAIENNAVLYVRIISQSGQTVSITNPWSGQSAQFYRNGTNEGTVSGATFSITTSTNDVLLLAPSGTSDATITAEMEYALSQLGGPYGGTPAGIPGTVLAENYDTGGQGVGYNVTSINGTDNSYRPDGVDLETTSAPGGGNDIGWTATGQWFRYTVNVAAAGTYNVTFEVAAPSAVTDGFHIANSSGTNLSGSVNVPSTGAWQTWTTATASVTLPAGEQVLTVYQDNGGWNIDSAVFAPASLPYNVHAIYTNGTSFSTGGVDGNGNALSATVLGASTTWNGATFTYGPANAPDAFSNVTIPLSAGTYSSLNVLAFAVNGSQPSQTFTVHYTNGTTSTATQSISDWGQSQGYSGETKVVTLPYTNTSTGGENTGGGYIYGYTIPVNSSLTVSSISIPANSHVIVLGVQDQQ